MDDAVFIALDATESQFAELDIPLAQLAPSPFNPRQLDGNDARVRALVPSLQKQQLQNILVRPLLENTTQRANDFADGYRYQIAAGHRRLAAAALAGLPSLRATVRALTDAQMREIHAVENMQRENLQALEEAQAFAQLAERDGLSYGQIAEKIGRSKSYVAGRLKLTALADNVRSALEAGQIDAEVAVLISRVHPQLQPAALKRALDRGPDGGRQSYRRIRDDLIEHYSLKLSEAIFNIRDGALLANTPACTECPKRTGGDLDLFGDLVKRDGYGKQGQNLCTDSICWEEKKKAHLKIEADKLAAKGVTLVTGGAARNAISAHGEVKGAYVALKDVRDDLDKIKATSPDKLPQVITLQDPRTGKTIKAVKREDAKAAGVKLESAERAGPQRSYEEQQRKAADQRKKTAAAAVVENQYRMRLLKAAHAQYAGAPRTASDLRLIVQHMLDHLPWNARNPLSELTGRRNGGLTNIAGLNEAELAVLMLDIVACTGLLVSENGWDRVDPKLPAGIADLVHRYRIDTAAVRAQAATERVAQIFPGDSIVLASGQRHEVLRTQLSESGEPLVVIMNDGAELKYRMSEVASVEPKSTPKKAGKKPSRAKAVSTSGEAADQTSTREGKAARKKRAVPANDIEQGAGEGE